MKKTEDMNKLMRIKANSLEFELNCIKNEDTLPCKEQKNG